MLGMDKFCLKQSRYKCKAKLKCADLQTTIIMMDVQPLLLSAPLFPLTNFLRFGSYTVTLLIILLESNIQLIVKINIPIY